MLLLRDGWCPPNVRGYYFDSAFQRKLQYKSVLITNSKQLETTRNNSNAMLNQGEALRTFLRFSEVLSTAADPIGGK
jgi:hypothetical protein